MDPDNKIASVVGVLFIVATVASILGSAALGSILEGRDYLVGVADHEAAVVLAVILFVTAATAAFGTALLLLPILRRHAEGLAASYVGLRAFENVLYVVGTVALLVMLSVSQDRSVGDANAADLPLFGSTLLALHQWSVLIGTMIFASLGAVVLNTVLFRARLVPRWLSGWGLAGAVLLFLYGVLGLFGASTGMDSPFVLLAMPIAVQEMVFAVRLIVKGLDRPQVRDDRTTEPSLALAAR